MPESVSPLIGIRDSGVGGLTVARRVRQLLPHASLLYFADTFHVPYGDKSPAQVRHYALSISNFLIEQGAQMVIFACNTSSAYALEAARQRFDVPILGVIEPGARLAVEASGGGTIGVLATQATVNSAVYTQTLQHLQPDVEVCEVACPDFVLLVESERARSQAAYEAAREYLQPLLKAGAQTVILGCTHFPLLLPVLREVAPRVRFVDPAEGVAQQAADLVASHQLTASASRDTFFISGEADGVRHWIQKLLPQPELDVQPGPIFDLPL